MNLLEYQDVVAWDMFATAALTMAYHPGSTRNGEQRMTVEEIAEIADMMYMERAKRFIRSTNETGD